MRGISFHFVILSTIAACFSVFAEETRDFYAEPGLHPYKGYVGQQDPENIDPFSGNLQLKHTDVTIPGNGGLDINITRTYNTPSGNPTFRRTVGYGWTMHYGRITLPTSSGGVSFGSDYVPDFCNMSPNANTSLNPSLELPDGGREVLFLSSLHGNDGTLITKSNWIARCIDDQDYTKGLLVTSPDGTVYQMDEYVYMQGDSAGEGQNPPMIKTWFTSKITDVEGNYLDISYEVLDPEDPFGLKYITDISASDGRSVQYEYDSTSGGPILTKIRVGAKVWEYIYETFQATNNSWSNIEHYRLKEVHRPDNTKWIYEYGLDSSAVDHLLITQVQYPFGGVVDYTYDWYVPYAPNVNSKVKAVKTKTQSGGSSGTATWTYDYSPGSYPVGDVKHFSSSNPGRPLDVTTITGPDSIEKFYHYGYWSLVGRLDAMWQMGMSVSHEYYNLAGTHLRSETNSINYRTISEQTYKQGLLTDLYDYDVYAPLVTSNSLWIETGTQDSYGVDYENFDVYGNPQRVIEASTNSLLPDRTTEKTFENDTQKWILGLTSSEDIYAGPDLIGSKTYDYNANGKLTSKTEFGVTTTYTYTSEGDLASETNALNKTTSYSNYHRGIPQLENYPDGTSLSRVVNASGTVASNTTGRGNTTSFSYDVMDRLAGIDYPIGNDVSINWTKNSKSLTRGNYVETVKWDGFGNNIEMSREDVSTATKYIRTYDYDDLGRQIFASDFNSAQGVSYQYDQFGRVTKKTNQDGTFSTVDYSGYWKQIDTDENGVQEERRFYSLGLPDNSRYLAEIYSDSSNIATFIYRDILGNMTSVFQGGLGVNPEDPANYYGYHRNYGFDEHNYLVTVEDVETGITTYGRDLLGNMTSKQVGAGATVSYTYDELNRLKTVDYPDQTPDASYFYDEDGNVVSVSNVNSSKVYGYDVNGNLISEVISIESDVYNLSYGYDLNDYLESITYPSGRVVSYLPNAFGRPTQAAPYATSVSYFPNGTIDTISYANGRTINYELNARNWVSSIDTGFDASKTLAYQFDNLGNITSIDWRNQTKSMTYDSLSRLKTAAGPWGTYEYHYDTWGNITQKDINGQAQFTHTYNGTQISESFNGIKETEYSFDQSGNLSGLLEFSVSGGSQLDVYRLGTYTHDLAGNLIQASLNTDDLAGNEVPTETGSFTAKYDADGAMVQKTSLHNSNRSTQFIYSKGGLLISEVENNSPQYGKDSFYLGTQLISTVKSNAPPTTDAGPDVQSYGGALFQLAGSGNDVDGQVTGYSWIQVSGPTAVINSPNSLSTSVEAPVSNVDEVLVFQLTLTDDRGDTSSDLVAVTVGSNHPPVSDAGADQNVLAGSLVVLDGAGSSDLEGAVTYQWNGTLVISNATESVATFIAEETGSNYSKNITLAVTDSNGITTTDSVTINVYSGITDGDGDGLSDGWEVVNFGDTTTYDGTNDPDGDGTSNVQEYLEGTNPNITNSPQAVQNVVVLASDSSNTIVWQRSLSANGYYLYWSNDSQAPFSSWNKVEVDGVNFRHEMINNGTEYFYSISARDSAGETNLSPIVSGIPNVNEWSSADQVPNDLTTYPFANRSVASNKIGDTVIVTDHFDNGSYQLRINRYSVMFGWSSEEVLLDSVEQHRSLNSDIDDFGNILVTWTEDSGTSISLKYLYYSVLDGWSAPGFVENYEYTGSLQIHGGVAGDSVSVQFFPNGSAVACWLQNVYHVSNGKYFNGQYSSMVNFFHPRMGWGTEQKLELSNNIGFTESISCDINDIGQVLVSWERRTEFNPSSQTLTNDDLWVSFYDPQSGWETPQTIEFILNGQEDVNGSDMENFSPDVALNNNGQGRIVWREDHNAAIHAMDYDWSTRSWINHEILESRSTKIPTRVKPKVSLTEAGDAAAFWRDSYAIKSSSDNSWQRSKSMPVGSVYQSVDQSGNPLSIEINGSDISASRLVNGSWTGSVLNESIDVASKSLESVKLLMTDQLLIHFQSDSSMYRSKQVAQSSGPSNSAPSANAGIDQSALEGASVTLDGNASNDSDGLISSYQWEQLTGTLVSINNAASPIADFTAPDVTGTEDLIFRLTVTDDQGATDTDTVVVSVQDSGPDLKPPVTAFSTDRQTVKGKPRHTVTLTPDEPATTYFRLTGDGVIETGGQPTNEWQVYTVPIEIQLPKNGSSTLEFYSIDTASNTEATNTEILQ